MGRQTVIPACRGQLGNWSSTICSISPIWPSSMRPRSATWRWSSTAAVKVERAPNNVLVTRWTIDQPAPPTFVKVGKFTGNVDRWQIIDYTPPAFLRLDVGACPTGTGAPEGRRVGGIGMRNLNAITPETETTAHYFWAQAHDFEPHNAEMTERVFEQIKTAFPRRRRGVHRAAAHDQPASGRAAGRYQRRRRRHAGPPHRRPALSRRAGRHAAHATAAE